MADKMRTAWLNYVIREPFRGTRYLHLLSLEQHAAKRHSSYKISALHTANSEQGFPLFEMQDSEKRPFRAWFKILMADCTLAVTILTALVQGIRLVLLEKVLSVWLCGGSLIGPRPVPILILVVEEVLFHCVSRLRPKQDSCQDGVQYRTERSEPGTRVRRPDGGLPLHPFLFF